MYTHDHKSARVWLNRKSGQKPPHLGHIVYFYFVRLLSKYKSLFWMQSLGNWVSVPLYRFCWCFMLFVWWQEHVCCCFPPQLISLHTVENKKKKSRENKGVLTLGDPYRAQAHLTPKVGFVWPVWSLRAKLDSSTVRLEVWSLTLPEHRTRT